MNQEGYTLAETLVALATIGLAMGGLTAGVRLIGLNQAAINHSLAAGQDLRVASQAFAGLLTGRGPFASDDAALLSGAADQLSFDCDAAKPCSARLIPADGALTLRVQAPGAVTQVKLPAVGQAHFLYVGSRTQGTAWPSAGKDPEPLLLVVLVGGGGRGEAPLAVARVWREQGADCVFDPVVGNCRKGGA